MRKMLAGAVLSIATAASALELQVVDRDGRPLPFAQVQVLGRSGFAMADAEGRVSIQPDPRPPFELLVTDAGGVLARPVVVESVSAAGPLRVTVDSGIEEQVDVLAAVPDAVLPPAAARTVIGRGDLEARNPANLIDVLGTMPGAGRLGDGVSAVPSLRGLARSRTLLLLDEGRISAERRAGPSATFLEAETLAEVEVVRGPGSVAYGSEAFGGVIRMYTRMPSPQASPSLRYSALYGSNADSTAFNLEWSGPLAGGGVLIGGHQRKADRYESPQGEQFNSEYETRGARVGYQRQLGAGVLSALWRSDFGVDNGKPDSNSLTDTTTYPQEDSHRLALGYQLPGRGAWTRLGWHLNWADYELITSRDRAPTSSRGRRLSTADVDAKDLGLRFDAERTLAAGGAAPVTLVTGVDLTSRYGLHATNLFLNYDLDGALDSRTFEVAVDDARRVDAGLFAQLTADHQRFSWGAGVRFDHVGTRNRDGYFGNRSTSESQFSGFLSGTARFGAGLGLTAQVSRGFRESLLSDRYFRGVSGRGFVVGNPDLVPETSTQYDVALRWDGAPAGGNAGGRSNHWRAALYLFRYQIDDFIERFTDGNDFAFRNRQRSTLEGVEFEVAALLPARLELNLSLSSLSGEIDADRFVDTVTPAADVTPHTLLLQIRQRVGERWSWMARTASYRRDDRPGETERSIPGYSVYDASLAFRLIAPRGGSGSQATAELQLLGRNLTDKAYFASPDEAVPLAPGRSLELTVRGSF